MTAAFRTSYLDHAALTAQLEAWAKAHPQLVRLESIGASVAGRPLWLLRIGKDLAEPRPAVWIDGNMHASELCGSSVALAIAEDVLALHQGAAPAGLPNAVADAVRELHFYILPRMSPDGAEATLKSGRYVRSSPADERPHRGHAHWCAEDVDGDGLITSMRQRSDAGELAELPGFPSFAAPADSVRVVSNAPKGCRYVGSVAIASERVIPVMNDESTGRHAAKKAKKAINTARAEAADIGADTLVIPNGDPDARMVGGRARAYLCDYSVHSDRNGEHNDQDTTGPSERARRGKNGLAVFEPLGINTALGAGQAVTLGKYLGPNSLIEISAAYTTASLSDSQSFSMAGGTDNSFGDNARIDGHSSLVALRYRRFVGNSFYWYAGPADRLTQATMYVVPEDTTVAPTRIAAVDNHDLGVTGAIGNAWQWENFTIGCDWIGLYMPLVTLKRSYTDFGQDVTSYSTDIASSRDSFKSQTSSADAIGLRLYVGASF